MVNLIFQFLTQNFSIFDYACLRKIISATRAPRVNLTIKATTGMREAPKALQSDYIEKLHVKAHW